jgi:hypothetical protein
LTAALMLAMVAASLHLRVPPPAFLLHAIFSAEQTERTC